MRRSRVFRQAAVLCLGAATFCAIPLTSGAERRAAARWYEPIVLDGISSSGDATIFPPGQPVGGAGSVIYAGRNGNGAITVDGGSMYGFGQIFLGAPRSGFPFTAGATGTLTLTGSGTRVGAGFIFAGGSGTANANGGGFGTIVLEAGTSLAAGTSVFGPQSSLTMTSATFSGGLDVSGSAAFTATGSTLTGSVGLNASGGTFSGGTFGDSVNFGASALRLGSGVGQAATMLISDAATVNVGEVVVGLAQPDVLPAATLTIEAGTGFTATNFRVGQIGDQLFGHGFALIDGPTTTLSVRSTLEVGGQGTGELDVRNGAIVTTEYFNLNGGLGLPPSPSFVSRFDLRTGSSLTVGTELLIGRGVGTVRELSTLRTDGTARVGTEAQLGSLEVVGAYYFATAPVTIGYRGLGELLVHDPQSLLPLGAASFRAPSVVLGEGVGGFGTLTISETAAADIDALTIGAVGNGTPNNGGAGILRLQSGGSVVSDTATIATFNSGSNPARLSLAQIGGTNSRWDVGSLTLGVANAPASASIEVLAGGTLATVTANVGYNGNTVSVNGGTWTNTGVLEIGGFNYNGAGPKVTVSNGGVLAASVLSVGSPDPAANSRGTLEVNAGGTVVVQSPLLVGAIGNAVDGTGGNGLVRMTGGTLTTLFGASIGLSREGATSDRRNEVRIEGGTWNLSDHLTIGEGTYGEGRVTIVTGGELLLDSTPTVLGRGRLGVLNVQGGNFQTNDSLAVGEQGAADFRISNGGRAITATTVIGQNAATATRSASFGNVTINGTNGTQSGTEWTNSSDVTIGQNGTGVVTLDQQAAVTVGGQTYVAWEAGSVGTLNVRGLSLWQSLGDLEIGRRGTGTLEITGGATVQALFTTVGNLFGSNGTVTVSGSGPGPDFLRSTLTTASESMFVGNFGTGTLTITDHGRVLSNVGYVGVETGGVGTAVLDTSGQWTNDATLIIGERGQGTLRLLGASSVQNQDGYVGRLPGSQGLVVVDGISTWTNFDKLIVGGQGNGEVQILGGSALFSASGSVAANPGGIGTISISDRVTSGSSTFRSTWTITGDLEVGGSGAGTLTILDYGLVTGSAGALGARPLSTGTATVKSGGEWRMTADLTVGAEGNGMLTVSDGGIVAANGARIGRNAGTTGSVSVSGSLAGVLAQFNYGFGQMNVGEDGTGIVTMGFDGAFTGQSVVLGVGPMGNGTVNVSGGLWTNRAEFVVGGAGTGLLTQTGGRMETVDFTVGRDAGGHGIVNTSLASAPFAGITASGTMTIGGAGTGTLGITNSGRVTSATTILGAAATGVGTLTLRDSDSVWSPGALTVGESGHGTLDLQDAVVLVSALTFGHLNGGRGDLTLTHGSLSTNVDAIVGAAGRGVVTLDGSFGVAGSTLFHSDGLILGQAATGNGSFTADGAGALVELASSLTIGDKGTGSVTLKNGARLVQDDPAQNLAIASDFGSTGELVLRSGAVLQSNATVDLGRGTARLQMTSGSTATFTGGLRLGINSALNESSSALVDLGDVGTILTTDFTVLRGRGLNQISIHDGAVLLTNALTVGSSGTTIIFPEFRNIVSIDGAGSRLTTNNGFLSVGAAGAYGQVNLTNQALLRTGPATVGASDGGAGQVNLASGARWEAANVQIGSTRTTASSIVINQGGQMTAGQVKVGGGSLQDPFKAAELVIDGGGNAGVATFLDAATVFIGGPTAAGNSGRGTVTVARNGLLRTASGIFLEQNGALYTGNGGAVRSDIINRGGVMSGDQGRVVTLGVGAAERLPSGPLAYGASAFSIDGSYAQEAGQWIIGVGGAGAGQFDQLTISGSVTLTGGEVQFAFEGGYLPQTGERFQFVLGATNVTIGSGVAFSYEGAAAGFLFDVTALSDGSLEFRALNDAVPEPSTWVLLIVAGALRFAWASRARGAARS